MYKRIIPTLLGAFMLFFSGKSASTNKCGAVVEINGPDFGQVTRVEMRNLQTGDLTTFNNPTFPIYYLTNSGPQFEARFFLSGNYHFALYQTGWAGECNAINYHPASQGSITFNAYCGDYWLYFIETSEGDNFLCP